MKITIRKKIYKIKINKSMKLRVPIKKKIL